MHTKWKLKRKELAIGMISIKASALFQRKLIYKICPHCNKELNIKIYKEHERLYYNATKGIWSQDADSDNEGLISDFSSPGESNYDTDPTEKEILLEYSSENFTDELCNNDDVALQQQENASQGT